MITLDLILFFPTVEEGTCLMNATSVVEHLQMRVIVFATNTNKIPSVKQQTLTVNGVAILQHLFTWIVAGCTQSGKTVWVKTLLENAQRTIGPSPQRIIWCYCQWPPSYFDIVRTMPGIEFNEGIPEDIDEPDYFDVSQ